MNRIKRNTGNTWLTRLIHIGTIVGGLKHRADAHARGLFAFGPVSHLRRIDTGDVVGTASLACYHWRHCGGITALA